MSLPNQEILDAIKDLISEITGFKEDDENFTICERYCLSHVVHHTYPFVSKTTVKNLVNSFVSRFYGHGYFKVSQELNHQIKSFLNNEKLFEKNPQYDIQWSLLSLMGSLSSNLTLVKEVPELLPIDEEESETEDFDWKEYLTNDLPLLNRGNEELNKDDYDDDDDEDEDDDDEDDYDDGDDGDDEDDDYDGNDEDEDNYDEQKEEEEENDEELSEREKVEDKITNGIRVIEPKEKLCQKNKNLQVIFNNKILFTSKSSSEIRQKRLEEFLKSRKSKADLRSDIRKRGNITEKCDQLLNKEGIIKKTQLLSEFELMENILFQFQTGEKIFLRKGLINPALTSLTEDTLGNYLESLQPYFRVLRTFKDFDNELTEVRYSENCLDEGIIELQKSQSVATNNRKRKIPNVLLMYNMMLKKSLEPFQDELMEIVENLENYTLIQMNQKLQPHFFSLTSLYHVHNLAAKNWKKDSNWLSSIRILCVLYNAIMNATSKKMSFLYLNFFLQCFQVYLDVIESWISFADLIDPNDEFIIAKSVVEGNSESRCSEYEIRPYKTEIESSGIKNVVILDLIGEKMSQVGQSLEILRRLNRFVNTGTETSTFYQQLVKSINEKVLAQGKVESIPKPVKPPEKSRSIFSVKAIGFELEKDNGAGDSFRLETLSEILDGEEKTKEKTPEPEQIKVVNNKNFCGELIYSVVKNPFFKMTFDSIGMKEVEKQLEHAKARLKLNSAEEALTVVLKPEKGKSGIYPLHKIVTECFHKILEKRISGACALVKHIVLKECNLPTHLSLLRSTLLFNDSYLIQPFILTVFTQPVIWGSSYSLSLQLKECVRSYYKDYANGLSVFLSRNDAAKCENILQVIDVITVNYEVKWPLTLIITPDAMRKYNEIFRLALKLKWAHWALCSIHFEDKNINEKGSIRHRLQLLKFWLLSALGRINNYFLTQMTPSDLKLNSCNDLKEIIHEHSKFLNKIYHNCLLGEKSTEGKKLIVETLISLCMDLLLEGNEIEDAKLASIENTFASCHLLLSHLMSSLQK